MREPQPAHLCEQRRRAEFAIEERMPAILEDRVSESLSTDEAMRGYTRDTSLSAQV